MMNIVQNNILPSKKTNEENPIGLINLGNTCYMNSSLQCLLSTGLPDLLISSHTENLDGNIVIKKKPNRPLLHQFVTLCTYFNIQSKKLIKPNEFKQLFDEKSKGYGIGKYGPFEQKDAHEFLQALIDLLHEETKKHATIKCKEKNLPKNSIYQQAADTYSNYYSKGLSLFIPFCHGMYYNKSTCCHCNKESFVFEPYQSLTLELSNNQNITIQEALTNHFSEEILSEENQIYCESHMNMEANYPSKKKLELWWVPNLLIIVLKRFSLKEVKRGRNILMVPHKNNCPVKYPDILDLTEYIKLPSSKDKYKLKAVCNHYGAGISSGHYTATIFRKNPDRWYSVSDSTVNNSESPVEKYDSNAYMLFYEKI